MRGGCRVAASGQGHGREKSWERVGESRRRGKRCFEILGRWTGYMVVGFEGVKEFARSKAFGWVNWVEKRLIG